MPMLTQEQRDEMLIRMDERVGKLREDMKEAKSAAGFARCQVHAEKVDRIQSNTKWFKRTGLLAMVGVAGKYLYDFFMG